MRSPPQAHSQITHSALESIKQDLIDFRCVLRSWNSRSGVCTGGCVGIKCDQGRVIAIQLPWKGLGCKIWSKMGNLHSLRRISLHDNLLAGSIPQSLWLLLNLRGVYLFNNRLSGSIPPSITQSPSLQNFDLSNNQLNGTIPNIVSSSSKIYRLNLCYSAFSGEIPKSIGELKNLESFNVS
ncbi:putative non-specific serine/threonine protein kinase [Helianthus debilis subsp. tardiflorus]